MTSEPFRSPAYRIIAVPFEKIIPNTYNPNSVAPPEMKLLYLSILEDGYTQPIYPKDLPKEQKKFLGAHCQEIIQNTISKNQSLV